MTATTRRTARKPAPSPMHPADAEVRSALARHDAAEAAVKAFRTGTDAECDRLTAEAAEALEALEAAIRRRGNARTLGAAIDGRLVLLAPAFADPADPSEALPVAVIDATRIVVIG